MSQAELVNLYAQDVQRLLIAPGFCKGDTALLKSFRAERFNPLANVHINEDVPDAPRPRLRGMTAPVLLLLGECSYIPRGLAVDYFQAYDIARAQVIPGVGHVLWSNPEGQALMRDAIVRLVDGMPPSLPNEPTRGSASAFVEPGR